MLRDIRQWVCNIILDDQSKMLLSASPSTSYLHLLGETDFIGSGKPPKKRKRPKTSERHCAGKKKTQKVLDNFAIGVTYRSIAIGPALMIESTRR